MTFKFSYATPQEVAIRSLKSPGLEKREREREREMVAAVIVEVRKWAPGEKYGWKGGVPPVCLVDDAHCTRYNA